MGYPDLRAKEEQGTNLGQWQVTHQRVVSVVNYTHQMAALCKALGPEVPTGIWGLQGKMSLDSGKSQSLGWLHGKWVFQIPRRTGITSRASSREGCKFQRQRLKRNNRSKTGFCQATGVRCY